MPQSLRSRWPLLALALGLPLGLAACATSGVATSADSCAPAAELLSRQMADSGIVVAGEAPRRPEMIAALRFANLRLLLSQEAASLLFECRADQARAVREDQAEGRIWRLGAEFRIARIRAALRAETGAVQADSDRIAAADAVLIAAASAGGSLPPAANPVEMRQELELRRLAASNAARRESFGTLLLLGRRVTDADMDRSEASR